MKSHAIQRMVLCLAISLFATLSSAPAALSAEAKTETPDWFFHDIVKVDFVKQHITVPMPEDVMIIDARPFKPKHIKGHIPMSVSMPNTKFDKMTDILPENKDALLIFYCGGLKCKLSHKSARKAEALGYTNVKVFADGHPAWIKAGNYPSVSAEWVKSRLDKKADMVLVDSRPKRKKYDKGHIPTAISLPDMYFDKQKDRLPAEKDKTLVFYCGGYKCKLSHKSARKAMDMGYTSVKVFSGGYPDWKKLVGAPEAAKAAAPEIKAGEEEGSIDIEFFKKLVAEKPDSILLIDVRDKDEFSTGSMKNAVNIPVDFLEAQIKTLPADKPIVFICGTGARSGESFYMVQDLRPELKNVYYVEAEMTMHKDGSFEITKPAS